MKQDGGDRQLTQTVSLARFRRSHASTLEPATPRAVIAHVEHQLGELDRRSGNCAMCKSADLRMHLGWLRGMVASRPA